MSDIRDILEMERPSTEVTRESFINNKKQRQFER